MDQPENRQRAIPQGVLHARAARLAVRPFATRLGEWQSESIKLQAMAAREPDSNGQVRAAARALLEELKKAEAEFESKIEALPDPVRAQSTIGDTRRGFAMIRTRVDETLTRFSGTVR